MKRLVWLTFVLILGVGTVLAQAPATPAQPASAPMPTADQIIDNYVKATGGKEALAKVNSRVAKGKLDIAAANISGTFEAQNKGPNLTSMYAELANFGTIRQGFDGTVAWEANPMVGLREKTGVELADAKLEAELQRELKFKELFPKIEAKGKQKVGDKDAYVVLATPKEGTPITLYFDVQSGLILKDEQERETPEGKVPTQTFYEDYREVDGIKFPFKLRQVNPMFELVITFNEIKHNGTIDDTKFKKPAN
jgi:zinc protease